MRACERVCTRARDWENARAREREKASERENIGVNKSAHDTCAHCTHPCYFVGRHICWVLSYRDFGIAMERKTNLCRDTVESPDVQTLIEGDAVQVPVSTSYTQVSFSLTHTHTNTRTHTCLHTMAHTNTCSHNRWHLCVRSHSSLGHNASKSHAAPHSRRVDLKPW